MPDRSAVRYQPPGPDAAELELMLVSACEPALETSAGLAGRAITSAIVGRDGARAINLTDPALSPAALRAGGDWASIRSLWDGADARAALAALADGADGLHVVAPDAVPDTACARVAGLSVVVGRPIVLALPAPEDHAAALSWVKAAIRWLGAGEGRLGLRFIGDPPLAPDPIEPESY